MNHFWHGSKPVIGLIGAIGAGKSTAARCFERSGGKVIDADTIGHKALEQPDIIEKIVQRWGDRIKKSDGSLDRRTIARIVFANQEERRALEFMVFPFIGEECKKKIKEALDDSEIRFVVLDAAVLLEAGWNENVDRIVYIDAPRELRLARVSARSGWTEGDLKAREDAQWPVALKKAKSDVVLVNKSDSEELQQQIDRLLREWGVLRV
ncbi:MAG TPA: dephospho-CoA kinase [Gemmata sp.]|nr:dephospho-CoA kinase [Gemmata sp.]